MPKTSDSHQAYFFKRQLITIALVTIFLCVSMLYSNREMTFLLISFFSFLLTLTFLPKVKVILGYPYWLHILLYYMPLFLFPIIWGNSLQSFELNKNILLGIMIGVILLVSKFNELKEILSGSNMILYNKISKSEFSYRLYENFLSVVSEELYFRFLIIELMAISIGRWSILLSATLFTFSHWLNRWADKMFSVRSYIYHMLVGLSLGVYYYYTNSLIGCILAHFIFNSSHYILDYKRMKKREYTVTFDDYL